MKTTIIILILTFYSILGNSQTKIESEIFNAIISHEIEPGEPGFYIQCEKFQPSFDTSKFNKQAIISVPGKILKELKNSEGKIKDSVWSSKLIEKFYQRSDFYESRIKSRKCLKREEVKDLFKKTKERQTVISISQPLFDEEYKNCVVSITYWWYFGSASGHSYFLKKIYGKWVIIETFNS